MLSITTPSHDAFGLDSNTVNPHRICDTGTQDSVEKKQKKKKKRAREDDQPGATPGVEVHREKKKKKRKHHDEPEPATVVLAPVSLATPPTDASVEDSAPVKPKKKKKNKGKSRESVVMDPTDAQIEADSQASAAALLSAIVAASVTNPENTETNAQPHSFDPSLVHSPGQQFIQYPQMQYGYPPGVFDPSESQPSSVFAPPGGGGAFSELAFGSNDDLLRALQDLDMSKIANVLKSLGEASGASNGPNFSPQLSFMPSQLEQSALKQLSAPSNAILGLPPKPPSHKRVINMDLPGNNQHENPDHAHVLANKWLTAAKLSELVKEEGLVYKKGKFSVIEEQQLKTAMDKYQHEKRLTDAQILETIFSKHDHTRDNAFWSELTAAVPLRPIIAVYHHVRRKYHPMKQQGAWKPEEDSLLKQAVADVGQQWEKVGQRVGRMASDCRDRYRNHIINRDIRVTGHWSKEEEEKLTRIVTDMTVKQGKDIDNDVFWSRVTELMGGSRGRQQCRIKWTDVLSKTFKNEGQKPRWNQQDAFILVHKVDSLNVRDDSEIDWKLIPDPDWNLWSAHTLQRRWLTLKKGVKGYEDMTHQEIMDILRVKKAHLPPPPAPPAPPKKRKVTSAPTIHEPDPSVTNATTPEAGSSTGPGTSAETDRLES